MTYVDQRAALERLIRERREDYAGLSRLIGKNAAYIQQFIKRGIPRRLAEKDRADPGALFRDRRAAAWRPTRRRGARRLVPIPSWTWRFRCARSLCGDEQALSHIGFEEKWLKQLSRGRPGDLAMIRVQGDSMEPTLADGDDIMVDEADALAALRDGIYVYGSRICWS
jgi:hypothetical protein